jgi:UDP-N-acetyl-D-glucosamine dehydrogenase
MGLAYKKNINDPGESPAFKVIEELANLGARVRVYDPFVQSLATKAGVFVSAGSVEESLSGAECAVFWWTMPCLPRQEDCYKTRT